jgi:DNA repair exonuclease SbcCD ATPase subunit
MIILKELRWSNCFSYGEDNVLNLEKDVLTQLIGTNGAGKSSIPILIEEALFNKNSKGIKKAAILNRHNNASSYSIALDFTTDGVAYTIDVVRASSLKIKLLANEEDISSHTATSTFKTLESILGVDFKTFSQLVYQSTTSSLQFLTATDTNRKKFLIELLNLERYIELFSIFKDTHRSVQDSLTGIKGEISNIEQWLKGHKVLSTKRLVLTDLPDLPTEEIEGVAKLQLRMSNIIKTNKGIAQNQQYKALLKEIDPSELTKVLVKPEGSEEANAQIGALTAERKAAKAVIKKIEALSGKAQCPTCLQGVDEDFTDSLIADANSSISSTLTEINALQVQLSTLRTSSQKYYEHQEIVSDFERLSTLIDEDIPSTLESEKDLQSQIADLQAHIKEVKSQITKVTTDNTAATKYNTELDYLLGQVKEFKSNLLVKEAELKILTNDAANLEVLKKAFSTNGLVAYKIENLVKDLEEIANVYLSELSDGRFQLTFEVINDKLNVIILDNGDSIHILALSSGELARVNTATLLAIRNLMATLSKSKINILFLDEVINVLDDVGRERLIETLLGEVELNTFLVSHGYTHPLLNKVNVIKEKDISRLD